MGEVETPRRLRPRRRDGASAGALLVYLLLGNEGPKKRDKRLIVLGEAPFQTVATLADAL
jgi:hypothetical protein